MSLFMAISLNKLICSDLNFTALNAGTETEDDQIKQKIKQSVILYVERNTNIAICCWEKKNRWHVALQNTLVQLQSNQVYTSHVSIYSNQRVYQRIFFSFKQILSKLSCTEVIAEQTV